MTPAMTPERWRQIKEVFCAALEQDEGARDQWIELACVGDEALRHEVMSLIATHRGPPSFIDVPAMEYALQAVALPPPSSWLGRSVGHYRIIEQIGRGGMGAVFKAIRVEEQFEHQVAIKLLHQSHDPQILMRRFRAERQILARLSHPNIAHLLDAGRTEDGLPYLVMEYIRGEAIDVYCERRRLDLEARLRLFRTLCDAVHYVHRHLMVHGDLKCSNVLVNEDGIVKLLDFGIAKLLESAPDSTHFRLTGLLALTPEYASPEQLRGEPITTASDVYSLGMLLYWLLTLQPPYQFRSVAYYDLAKHICEQMPRPPSVAVNATPGAPCTPQQLRGDLDNIVLKALHKDPDRRYDSVEQLSQDVARYLGGFPVMAAPESARYRACKFVGRNRALVVAGSLLIISLVAGILATSWHAHLANRERQRAQRHFEDVRRLAQTFMLDVHDSMATLPGTTPARRLIIANTLKYLDALAKENSNDVAVQLDLARAYERVGNLHGGFQSANLQDTESALESYAKALEIRNALWAAGLQDADLLRDRLRSYMQVAQLSQSNRAMEEGRRYSQTALDLARMLTQRSGATLEDERLLATAHIVAGTLLAMNDIVEPGLADLRKGIAIYEKHIAAGDAPLITRRGVAVAYDRLGGLLASKTGRHADAVEAHERSLAVSDAILQEDPRNAEMRKVNAFTQLGAAQSLAELGEHEAALAWRRKAVKQLRELQATEPESEIYQFDLSWAEGDLAESLHASGDLVGAEAMLSEAQTRLQRHPGMHAARLNSTKFLVATNDLRMGRILLARAEQAKVTDHERRALWRRACALLERTASVFTIALEDSVFSEEAATKKNVAEMAMRECDSRMTVASANRTFSPSGQPQADR